MTTDPKEQIGLFFEDLNHPSRPVASSVFSDGGSIFCGCLVIAATLLFWPELREAVFAFQLWLHQLGSP